MRVNDRIRQRREEIGLSQEALSKRLGYSGKTTVSRMEIGKSDVPLRKLPEYADALHTTVEYLMGFSEEKEAFSEEEVQIIHKYREMPEEIRNAVRALCGMLPRE